MMYGEKKLDLPLLIIVVARLRVRPFPGTSSNGRHYVAQKIAGCTLPPDDLHEKQRVAQRN
jgi:hypothetical protein